MEWARVRGERTVWEDERALVLDKPAGISVTGERHDTDLVRIAAAAGERLYPVHRIDKVTSGLVLLAKELDAHGPLTRQFGERTVGKAYLAVTRSTGLPDAGAIELPLSVGRKNRVRIAAPREAIRQDGPLWTVDEAELLAGKNYPARTEFAVALRRAASTVVVARPVTGRRHQIRVHLAWIGHPIDGDPLFDRSATGRTRLHAWRLAFDVPWLDQRVALEALPDNEFWLDGTPDAEELAAAAGQLGQ